MNDVEVEFHGPWFDGRAKLAIHEACRSIQEHVAGYAADMVRSELNAVLKVQTPYYRLQVTTKNMPEQSIVYDGGVVYGPWLEGTGSRNRTTRFKGYATFRRVKVMINKDKVRIGNYVMARYMARMN